MIKNEREYRITKAQAATFRKALGSPRPESEPGSNESLANELQEEALRSQLEELEESLQQYEKLIRDKPKVISPNSIEELPIALIQARIASGLTQADLARQLGTSEQQVQRYEATNFSGASLRRIKEVADALKVRIQPNVFVDQSPDSLTELFRKLGALGITREFLERWILSPSMQTPAVDSTGSDFDIAAVVSRIARVFGWRQEELLKSTSLSFDTEVLSEVRYKKPKKADGKRVEALTVYAHYLALLALHATKHLGAKAMPKSAMAFRDQVIHRYSSFGYSEALQYVWDLGVPVVPLRASGALHGAMWRVEGRNVIVLKQSTMSIARWLIDLLHETYHAKDDPLEPSKAVIEIDDPMMIHREQSAEELNATEFAIEAALEGRAEKLFELCVNEAKGKVEWLKRVVPEVAKREMVDRGVLANALAHRLSEQGINWWPTAAGMQDKSQDPWTVARDVFLERVNLQSLNPIDRDILLRSLSQGETNEPS